MTRKVEEAKGVNPGRRDFLRMAATGAPAVAVATAASTGTAEAATPDPASDRMQDTAHTRAYFDSARF
ncbi:ubiquinol-cytochrome c reductase iron-sulfur subunit N-terminal domain-containing protein [Roseovarius sp. SYSU LYC5161]|uniref:ubiquinol-cytochrome c reductase iron-sulfur subunit N-terminal domain-containing protein n=1 Tax=Roseovarius halophilus (ex Wu et al. 2025) TaxID=3376060 RepID=UPI002871F276|nr:ubiquinol-cytochrome c reductase iron-sulfur subunit N-terminal domain-containing protein [Roseovarius sp.]